MKAIIRFCGLLTVSVCLFVGSPADSAAQTTFRACRVPDVGAIYMIGVSGAPTACLDGSHVEFSWSEGGAALADGSVTTAKLADDAVTAAKIVAGAVGSSEIADGSVSSTEIALGGIGTAQLQDGGVAAADIAAGAVGTAAIADGAVTAAKLGGDVNLSVAAGSIGTAELANGAVTSAKIATDAVGASQIAVGAVGSSEIATSAVGTSELANQSVTADKLQSGITLPLAVEIVSSTANLVNNTLGPIGTPTCPSGKIAIGGGANPGFYAAPAYDGTFAIQGQWPVGTTAWAFWFYNVSGVTVQTETYTVCARVN